MKDKIYEGVPEVEFICDVGIDLSTSSIFELHVLKPDETEVIWPATKHSNLNSITYTSKPEDLLIPGKYRLQAYVDGYLGQTTTFIIYKKYD